MKKQEEDPKKPLPTGGGLPIPTEPTPTIPPNEGGNYSQ